MFYSKTFFVNIQFRTYIFFDRSIFASVAKFYDIQYGYEMGPYIRVGDLIFAVGKHDISDLILACISFRDVIFEKPEYVFFDHVDLRVVSFIRTNIARVNFSNARWIEFGGGYVTFDQLLYILIHNDRMRKKYFNNISLEGIKNTKISELKRQLQKIFLSNVTGDNDLAFDNVLKTCRLLIENHDYYLKYEEAGKFLLAKWRQKD